ncbi:MAG: primosomal replication protein N [Betaproteobacteria bacterium RIFCSPLOWO2_12_FULL_62_13]|nr:MAG: primosomal replication protein N [Betaproteobacteria bacterium RIFCSPLOWO2_12_FULL_62_13]
MEVNTVALSGELAEVEPLRHTPAGVPLLSFKLAHKSWQIEAGYKRQVDCVMNAVAMGEVAVTMSRIQQGHTVSVEGFLNRKNRMSAQIVLHVTKAQT